AHPPSLTFQANQSSPARGEEFAPRQPKHPVPLAAHTSEAKEEQVAVATAPTKLRESQRNLNRRHRLLINGEWVEPASGKTFPTTNPPTGETLAEIASGEAEDINRAVAAARRAFESGPWPRMTPAERQKMIWRLSDLIEG